MIQEKEIASKTYEPLEPQSFGIGDEMRFICRKYNSPRVCFVFILTFSFFTFFYFPSLIEYFHNGIQVVHILKEPKPQLKHEITYEELLTDPLYLESNYDPFCGPHKLNHVSDSKNDSMHNHTKKDSSLCKVANVDEITCRQIIDQYYQTSQTGKCTKNTAYDFCKVREGSTERFGEDLLVSCSFDAYMNPSVCAIGTISRHTGMLTWIYFERDNLTEKAISDIAYRTLNDRNPFMFISCVSDDSEQVWSQLLVLPYVSYPLNEEPDYGKPSTANININLMLIDSVSRPHFYRSLPRTIKYLQSLKHINETEVLDFELFHSIKGRTFESLIALFTGKNPRISAKYEGVAVPPFAVDFKRIFKKLKNAGYDTLYQEDLCWEHDWGLIKDTGIYKENLPKSMRFRAFTDAIRKNFIDSLGLTHSTCEIFHAYNIIDHFNFPRPICYAGKLQHDYFLSYLKDAISKRREKPLFSFAVINVGHEGSGKRIRTFDDSFRDFLASTKDNAIHIIFSDHGNNYGPFALTMEGRFETFHPFMFMLIPQKIAKQIGQEKLANLKTNEQRLITLKDLHHTLLSLLSMSQKGTASSSVKMDLSNHGLFSPISSNRSCDDLDLLRGTLCYCENWKKSLPVGSVHYLIAEYVLAKMNKKIINALSKRRGSVKWSSKRRVCQQLIGQRLANVWQTRKDKLIVLGIDIIVQYDEVFSVTVSAKFDEISSFDFEITSLERQTSYGKYKKCANPKVPLSYCVCSLLASNKKDINAIPGAAISSMFDAKTKSREVHHNCLYILTRVYSAGVVFEASNACWNVSYTVTLVFKLENMKQASYNHDTYVPPGAVRHLAVIIMVEPGFQWSYEYTVRLGWNEVEKLMVNDKTRT